VHERILAYFQQIVFIFFNLLLAEVVPVAQWAFIISLVLQLVETVAMQTVPTI
jgi:hypothetical protein